MWIRFDDCSVDERDARAKEDLRRLEALLQADDRLQRDVLAHKELFDRDDDAPLTATERVVAMQLFDRAVDLQSAANSITRFHMGFVGIDPLSEPSRHARHFALAHRAYFRRLSSGMDLCQRALGKSAFEVLLDEGSPEFGIGAGQWSNFKWNILHVEHVGRAIAARQHRKLLDEWLDAKADRDVAPLLERLDGDWTILRRYLKEEAPTMLMKNALELLKGAGHALILPLQTEIAGWLGDTRVYRDGTALISSAQHEEAIAKSAPGDVLFERRNWYLSNIGLPGFWPHAAMWVGTPAELQSHIAEDPDVRAAYGGSFVEFLQRHHGEAFADWLRKDDGGHDKRVIEAVSEGVVLASAEHTLHADYAAALRPRRTKLDVARAIEQAFSYWGRPYDFDFDFFSDQSIVCSELVYKAWEPRPGIQGIEFPLESVLGRRTLPPNSMVGWWDARVEEGNSPLDFLWFLDGREATSSALWGDERSLRDSHRRPKWDLSQE